MLTGGQNLAVGGDHIHGQQVVESDKRRPVRPRTVARALKLLRQISVEFSSFASSPTPRPEVTALPALIEEVIEPYRTGLANRIAIMKNRPTTIALPKA